MADSVAQLKANCIDCKKPYYEFGMDVSMAYNDWIKINPNVHGLLCANCIVKRASKVDGVITVALRLDYR